MKGKSSHHKSENTFKFLTFSERLANVNIDIIHRINRTESNSEEVETYFYEGLQKWRELNLTQHFMTFYREVSTKCQSFNQLVHHQGAIVQSLKTHLQIKNSLAYQPLLELVVQLARDLQTDFYPHFRDFFVTAVSLLDSKDTALLEWVFTALSYLYKYLWRLMVKDVPNIYRFHSTLLAHRKAHIRNFAAESFAFLMRKVPEQNALFNLIFVDLEKHPEKAEGVGQLLFEMCKGVRNMFHSSASKVINVILQKLGPITEIAVTLPWTTVGEVFKHMVESAASYIHREHFDVLFKCLQESLLGLCEKITSSNRLECSDQIERILRVYLLLVEHEEGAKIPKPKEVCQTMTEVLKTPGLSEGCCESLLEIISTLFLDERVSLPGAAMEDTVKQVFASSFERHLILKFCEGMCPMRQFEQHFLPSFLQYVELCFRAEESRYRDEALVLLAKLILEKAEPPSVGSMAFEKYSILFTADAMVLTDGKDKSGTCQEKGHVAVLDYVLSLIELPEEKGTADLSQAWTALIVLPHIRPLRKEAIVPRLIHFIDSLFASFDQGRFSQGSFFVTCQAVNALLSLDESSEVLHLVPTDRVKNLLIPDSNSSSEVDLSPQRDQITPPPDL